MIALASGFGALLSLVFLVSAFGKLADLPGTCLLYTSPSPRDRG